MNILPNIFAYKSHFFPKGLSLGKKKALLLISLVSFLWSTSSLIVVSILPAFLVDELEISHKGLGFIEGLALCFSFLAKVFSGVISDFLRSRKPLIVFGSFLTLLAKPGFALAYGLKGAFLARFLDRFSKGFRSAPTDALLADIGSGPFYGFIYGFRQSFYTSGAVFGAFLTMVLIECLGPNYRVIFSIATLPALFSLLLLAKIKVKKNKRPLSWKDYKGNFFLKDLKSFPSRYWFLMVIICFLMLARFSEAFITLRIKDLGLSLKYIPAIVIVMDLIHVIVALPFGKYADQISPYKLLFSGMVVQLFAAFVMVNAGSLKAGFFGIACIGVSMGMTQGVLRALVALSCPRRLRGSGFAIFYLFSGISVFIGNGIAGYLGDEFGISVVFLSAVFFTTIAIVLQFFGHVLSYIKTSTQNRILAK